MAEASKRAAGIRRKQLLILVGIGVAIALVSIGAAVWMQPSNKGKDPSDQPTTKELTLGANSLDKDAWRAQSAAELETMKRQLKDLQNAEKQRQDAASQAAGHDAQGSPLQLRGASSSQSISGPVVAPPPPPMRPPESPFRQVGTGSSPPPPPVRPNASQKPPGGPGGDLHDTGGRIRTVSLNEAQAPATAAKGPGGDLINSARAFGQEEARRRGDSGAQAGEGKDRYSNDDPLTYNRAAGRSAETYLPAGTFVRAALLNGLDAPTGGQAQSNPHPVLLRLVDSAQLPNSFKANLKDCVVTGNGMGDLSSERAYIRLDRLSCVDDDGGAIDVAIRGYVSGEDGKTGLRGRLVTKTGQIIGNALLVGSLSGFGEALRQGAVSTTTATATGAQTQTVNNAVEYGLGTGVGKAMDRIAQYYIHLADKLFPVVEVDGGRVVDVVLSLGVSIERK